MVGALESHRADVVGFQEMQAVQARTFSELAGFEYGDMNDSRRAFFRFKPSGDLYAAAGGTHAGLCRAPAYRGIDWIFGSTGTRFPTFTVDRSPLVQRTTDHPAVFAQVG